MMLRNLLPLLLLLTVVVFGVQAQDNKQDNKNEEKATAQADIIVKYINSKITDESGHLTAEQQDKIKQAYLDYYADKAAYKVRKKEFLTTYKTWKAAVSQPVSAEEKEKLEAQKKEIAIENKALNKESKEMRTRREAKIKEALEEGQEEIFVAMREEQASKDDDDDSK